MRHRSGEEWIRYDQDEIDRRRALLRDFLDSPEAAEIAQDVRCVLPTRHFGSSAQKNVDRHNTERAYRSDQRPYIAAFAKANVEPLAPTRETWEAYFEKRATTPINGKLPRYRSLLRHAFGIANLFHQHGLPSPTRTWAHKRLMRKLARYDNRQTKKAKPLYGEDVHILVASYESSSLVDQRDRSIAVVGGTRGFRACSIANLRIENIEFAPEGVVTGLRDEKTSVTRELIYTGTPHSKEHRSCMPCILKEYIDCLASLGITEGPLFRKIDRWGHMGTQPLSTASVTLILRKGLRRAEIDDADSYSSHSFRHGVVKTGVKKRLPLEEIMVNTLHRSKKGLQAYIDGIDPWYNSPKQSILDDNRIDAGDENRGWHHAHR